MQCFIQILGFRVAVLLVSCCVLQAQPARLQGIINAYTPVLAIKECMFITVAHADEFAEGDRVLLIQMQGAEIDVTDSGNFGRIMAYNNAGNNEFATIARIVGKDIRLTANLVHEYTPSGAVQLVRVARYQNAEIIGDVTAPPWNGVVGGIVAIEVAETLRFSADIDVSGVGFRGGAVSAPLLQPNQRGYVYPHSSGFSGQKGEGIARYVPEADAGRGAQANGGGGGNDHNSGGGGGSNLTPGGKGGNQWNGFGTIDIGGLPGWALETIAQEERIYFGGGGGGGHQNEWVGTPGTAGGGIAIVRAREIQGYRYAIQANGLNQEANSRQDGAGGAGAGGTIVVEVETVDSPLRILAKGGAGGSTLFSNGCVGPGGGGAGGVVWLSDASLPSQFQVIDLSGGEPGLHLNTASSCHNTSYGAGPGAVGIVRTGLRIPEGEPLPPLDIEGPTFLCEGASIILNVPKGYARYEWSHGATGPSAEISEAGTYRVTAFDQAGCAFESDEVRVEVPPQPEAVIAGDLKLCPGESTTLDAGGPFAHYEWSTGETSRIIEVAEPGIFWLIVTDIHGCRSDADTVEVWFDPHGAVIEFVAAGEIVELPDATVSTIVCSKLLLRNASEEEFTLSSLHLQRNLEFSIPAHQFPLRLKPHEEKTLTVCFAPTAIGEFEDILRLESDCRPQEITLQAAGIALHASGLSNCNVPLQLGSAAGEGAALRISTPYPVPARGFIEVPVYTVGSSTFPSIDAALHDSMGRKVTSGMMRSSVPFAVHNDSTVHLHHIVFELAAVPPGMYLAKIRSVQGIATIAVVVAD